MIIFKNKKLEIPVGLGPNFQEGSGEILNQNKTVDSSTFFQRVYPDPGFTGLGRVTINPYELDAKTVDSSTEMQVVTSDKDGLYRVVVKPYQLESITLDSSTEYQTITGAYDEITVNPYTLDEKTVDSSSATQVVTSDKDGLSKVTVRPYVLDTLRVDSSTVAQTIEGAFGEVNVNPYILDEKTVDSSTVLQVVHSDNDGLSQVTINPYILDEKTVNSSTNTQEITSDADGLSKVVINPYSLDEKTVDSSTNPQVITSDEDGLRQVTIRPYVLSPLEVDSSTAMQEITGQYGTVTVNPYTLDEKTVDSSTKEQTITSDADGLSKVTIKPYVLSPLEVDSSTASQEITGQYGTVKVNPYVLDSKTVDPSTNNITVTSSKDGLSSVTVNHVTSSIDSNIKAGNIKKDITILGVTGTYEGGGDPVPVPVEYISNEGSLNLVFNSGYIPNDNTRIVARIAWGGEGQPGTGAWGNYFGVQNNFALREWGGYGSATGEITWQTIGGTCAVQNVYTTPGDLSIVRDIEVGNNYVKADSSSGSSAKYSGHISDSPMFIFGAADPGNGQLTELSSRVMRIHSFAIYEGTTLIKNLVPYQDANLNGCFFDTVSETYIYPLQGTPTVGPVAIYQQKTVDAGLSPIEVTADTGFKALSKVTVNGVTAAVDPNITPGNIKAGVNILGVGGSFAGAIYHRIGYVANNSTDKKIFRNTGIIPKNNTRIEATVSFDDINTGQSGYGYFWGTTNGASFVVREMGGYGSRNISYFDGNGIGYYSSDMSSAPRTYTHGQVEGDYSFMSYGGYIDKRSPWSHTWTTGDEIFIWAANKGNDTVDEYSSRVMRLYDFKIYEGDNLVFHGVPAADNEGACVLIDLVSNKMVEGEGTLTGGGVYVESDEENYIENGEYELESSIGDVYFNLGSQLNMYDISDSTNVKLYVEVVASVPHKKANANDGSINKKSSILGNLTSYSTGDQFLIGNYSDHQAQFTLQRDNIYASGIAPGMNTYTMMAYKNNNATYNGGKLCAYINNVPAEIIPISLSNASTGSDVYVFKAKGDDKWNCVRGTKIYQIKYYKPSDGLVHILVPAYNNGQYCFKDVIDNTYLYAAASTPTGHVSNHYLTNNGAIDIFNG